MYNNPLHTNTPVANFQRFKDVFTCPITLISSCLCCTLSHACILHKWLCFCVLCCIVTYRYSSRGFQAQHAHKQTWSIINVASIAKKQQMITMETKVKIIERVEQAEKMEMSLVLITWLIHPSVHNSKEQGQDHGTCEFCCTDDVDKNIKEGWKNDGRGGETSQCVDTRSASVWRPAQLNADSRER